MGDDLPVNPEMLFGNDAGMKAGRSLFSALLRQTLGVIRLIQKCFQGLRHGFGPGWISQNPRDTILNKVRYAADV